MVVAKVLAQGVLIVGLAGSLAHAAPILTLATTSSNSSTISNAPRFTSQLGLSLGTSQSSARTFAIAPAPVVAPAPVPVAAPVPVPAVAPAPVVAPVMARQVEFSPIMAQNIPAPANMPTPVTPWAPVGQATADAFLNMGTGPYDAAYSVTAGGASGWFNSPQVARLFGGMPDARQRQLFEDSVYSRVLHTFNLSGVPLNLTKDPNVPAAHSLSVVSGSYSPLLPSAIGMTQIGGDGFTFIDQAAKAAFNVDQLSWIVSHNVAHELMLAFGVPEEHDESGHFIDARNANWDMMVNPSSTFSPSAARALLAKDFKARGGGLSLAAQVIGPDPVPEPATIAMWGVAASAVALFRAQKFRLANRG